MASYPYTVKKAVISTFGTLIDVRPDSNCLFTAHWESKCHKENNKSTLGINTHHFSLYSYASSNWHDILSSMYDSRGITLYGNFKRKRFVYKEELV